MSEEFKKRGRNPAGGEGRPAAPQIRSLAFRPTTPHIIKTDTKSLQCAVGGSVGQIAVMRCF